jgi:hypothetical protein
MLHAFPDPVAVADAGQLAELCRDDTRPARALPPWEADAAYRALRIARGREKAAELVTDDDKANALIADWWTPAEIAALWPEMFGPVASPSAAAVCRRTAHALDRLIGLVDGSRPLPQSRDFRQLLLSELTTAAAMCRAIGGQVS